MCGEASRRVMARGPISVGIVGVVAEPVGAQRVARLRAHSAGGRGVGVAPGLGECRDNVGRAVPYLIVVISVVLRLVIVARSLVDGTRMSMIARQRRAGVVVVIVVVVVVLSLCAEWGAVRRGWSQCRRRFAVASERRQCRSSSGVRHFVVSVVSSRMEALHRRW